MLGYLHGERRDIVQAPPRSPMLFRTTRAGPEAELVQQILVRGFPFPYRAKPHVLLEPELPTGFPDIILLYPRDGAFSLPTEPALTSIHLRYMHQIWASGGVSLTSLASLLGETERRVQSIVETLHQRSMVNIRGTFLRAKRLREIFLLNHIVAIEAKIDNWQKGIRQAQDNLWFASESYLLMPAYKKKQDAIRAAAKAHVGLLACDDHSSTMRLASRRFDIPSSYGSWILNEWLVRQKGRRP